jgi:hypothetical protein
MVRFWANAADTVGDTRHLLSRTADAELLESTQFRYLKIGVSGI